MPGHPEQVLKNHILPVLTDKLQRVLLGLPDIYLEELVEIRLRVKNPLMVETVDEELLLGKGGEIVSHPEAGYRISSREIQEVLNLMTRSSLYTLEEELKSGYLTLPGGHRVGFVGQAIRSGGEIERIKYISGLNIRLCQEIIGAGDKVIDRIVAGEKDVYNTLIISPPSCGKTTLLRDLVRQISNGVDRLEFKGLRVGVVDERSELSGAHQGVPQADLGIRTDVLDRAPKGEGALLLIRSMSPEVIAMDEIGTKKDVEVIREALNAGVRVITTVHGRDITEVSSRPILNELLESSIFRRYIVLSRREGPGTVEEVKEM